MIILKIIDPKVSHIFVHDKKIDRFDMNMTSFHDWSVNDITEDWKIRTWLTLSIFKTYWYRIVSTIFLKLLESF